MNPFTDQWSDTPATSNPAPNFTIPPINEQHQQPVLFSNDPYSSSDGFKNVPINQTTNANQSATAQANETPSSLPKRIYNEIFSNYEMMICKLFYLLFYCAFGSLFPLIGIYFKQQGMSATETGILIGCRYIVEIFSAPFWASLADKFNKGKTILIGSLISWIILTSALAFIRPPAAACVSYNGTDFILYQPYLEDTTVTEAKNIRNKRSLTGEHEKILYFRTGYASLQVQLNKIREKPKKEQEISRLPYELKFDQQMRLPPNHKIGKSPLTIEYALNYDNDLHSTYVSPPFSHIVYRQSEVDEVFILLLLLMLIGEFFGAPTITLIDTITIRRLSNNLNNYSKQRMFGSFGWAMAMLIVGLALDNSTEFTNHPCGAHIRERNYSVCFKIFAFLMTIACIVATQFNFDFEDNQIESTEASQKGQPATNPFSQTNTLAPSENTVFLNGKKRKFEFLDQWKSGVFAQRFNRRPEWYTLFKSITNIKLVALISLAWFMGLGVGLVFTFLFWHLQDIGGTPTLFGIASVINHFSEIVAYFNSLHYIKKYGHTRVFSLALLCNFLRFLYISYIDNSWLILPFELVQGITHATVWACFCSYLNHTIPENAKNSTQAILQIVYSGFGKGLGSIIGGFLISAYGTRYTFALYAFASLIAICIFVLIMNVYNKQLAPTVNLGERTASGRNRQSWLEDDLKNRAAGGLTVNESQYDERGGFPVSPHGVPTAPIGAANRTPAKTAQPSSSNKTRIDPKINYNDVDLDDYITRNHRDWRITMNKSYD